MTTPALSHPRVASEADLRALLETKNKVLSHDDAEGTVEILAGVTNIVDHVGDVVEPGAYSRTLKERNPKGCKSHDHKTPLARSIKSEEWLPGDPRLPKKFHELGAGALYVKLQYNTERGPDGNYLAPQSAQEYHMVKFMGDDGEWSIGYDCSGKKGKAVKNPKTGYRHIKDLTLYEVSSVLAGAAPHTGTIGVKSLGGEDLDWSFFDAGLVRETKGISESLYVDDEQNVYDRKAYFDDVDDGDEWGAEDPYDEEDEDGTYFGSVDAGDEWGMDEWGMDDYGNPTGKALDLAGAAAIENDEGNRALTARQQAEFYESQHPDQPVYRIHPDGSIHKYSDATDAPGVAVTLAQAQALMAKAHAQGDVDSPEVDHDHDGLVAEGTPQMHRVQSASSGPRRRTRRRKSDFLEDAEGKLTHLTARNRGSRIAYNPDAVDADHDMIVQEGTPYARPATGSVRRVVDAARPGSTARPGDTFKPVYRKAPGYSHGFNVYDTNAHLYSRYGLVVQNPDDGTWWASDGMRNERGFKSRKEATAALHRIRGGKPVLDRPAAPNGRPSDAELAETNRRLAALGNANQMQLRHSRGAREDMLAVDRSHDDPRAFARGVAAIFEGDKPGRFTGTEHRDTGPGGEGTGVRFNSAGGDEMANLPGAPMPKSPRITELNRDIRKAEADLTQQRFGSAEHRRVQNRLADLNVQLQNEIRARQRDQVSYDNLYNREMARRESTPDSRAALRAMTPDAEHDNPAAGTGKIGRGNDPYDPTMAHADDAIRDDADITANNLDASEGGFADRDPAWRGTFEQHFLYNLRQGMGRQDALNDARDTTDRYAAAAAQDAEDYRAGRIGGSTPDSRAALRAMTPDVPREGDKRIGEDPEFDAEMFRALGLQSQGNDEMFDPAVAKVLSGFGVTKKIDQAEVARALSDPRNAMGPPATPENLRAALDAARPTINTYNAYRPEVEADAVKVPNLPWDDPNHEYTMTGWKTSGDSMVDDVLARATALSQASPGATVGHVLDATYTSYNRRERDKTPDDRRLANRSMLALTAQEEYRKNNKARAAEAARAKDLKRADKNPELIARLRTNLGITDDPDQNDRRYFNQYDDARLAAGVLLKYVAADKRGKGGKANPNLIALAIGTQRGPVDRGFQEDYDRQVEGVLETAQQFHQAMPEASLQAVLFAAGDYLYETGARDTTGESESWVTAQRAIARRAYQDYAKSTKGDDLNLTMSAEDTMAAANDAVDAWLAAEFADEGVVGWVEDVYDDRMAVGVAAYGPDGQPVVELWDVDIESWDEGVPTLGEPELVPLGHIGVAKGDSLECLSAAEIVASAINYKSALRRRRDYVYEYGPGRIDATSRYLLTPEHEVKDVFTSSPTGAIEHGFSPIKRMRKRKRDQDRNCGVDVIGTEMMKAAAAVLGEVQAAVTEDMEAKVGRVLSRANLTRIEAALGTLNEMLATARIVDAAEAGEADISDEAEAFKAMIDGDLLAEFEAEVKKADDLGKYEGLTHDQIMAKVRDDSSYGGIRNSRQFQNDQARKIEKALAQRKASANAGAVGARAGVQVGQNRPVERDHDGDGIVQEGTPNAHRVNRPATTTRTVGGGGGGGGGKPRPKVDKHSPEYFANLGQTGFDGEKTYYGFARDDVSTTTTIETEVKREFSREERDKAADSGAALPDGSFPIKTRSDLANAIQAWGRAKDKAAAKAHIISRARALNAMSSLPDGWA